jgi:hypothetical protein
VIGWGGWGSAILVSTLVVELLNHPCPAELKRIPDTDNTIRVINRERAGTPTSSGDGFGEYDLERARALVMAELTRPVIFYVSSGAAVQ